MCFVTVAWDLKDPLLDTRLGQRLLCSVRVRDGSGYPPSCLSNGYRAAELL